MVVYGETYNKHKFNHWYILCLTNYIESSKSTSRTGQLYLEFAEMIKKSILINGIQKLTVQQASRAQIQHCAAHSPVSRPHQVLLHE